MSRRAIPCVFAAPGVFAALAALGAVEPSKPVAEDCPHREGEVVVKALRFNEGPPAFAFMVTNNGARPIWSLKLGTLEDTFIEAQFATVPTSVGAPAGWEGMHVFGQDPRLPGAHSHSLISYNWNALDHPELWIQPRRSLAGFSVQFPEPKKDPPGEVRRRTVHPDLANTVFRVRAYGARCPIVGVVEPDGVGASVDGAVAPRTPVDGSQRDADHGGQDP